MSTPDAGDPTQPPAGAMTGAYFVDIETVVVGGTLTEEPFPEASDDADAPVIVSAEAVNIDDDEAAIDLVIESGFVPTKLHLQLMDVHVTVDILPPPTDYDEGHTTDLPGYSYTTCRDTYTSCYQPCFEACEVFRACDEPDPVYSQVDLCAVRCSVAANNYYRCPRTHREISTTQYCPTLTYLHNLPDTLEAFVAGYVTNHRFLCSEDGVLSWCAPPEGYYPDEPSPGSGPLACVYNKRAELGSETDAPPRKQRRVRAPLQVFNFALLAQAPMAMAVTAERVADRPPITSEGLAPGMVNLNTACPQGVQCGQ